MCFDIDSTPPIRAIAGAAVSHDSLTLTAADGNEFAAFLATPEARRATGRRDLPDVRGPVPLLRRARASLRRARATPRSPSTTSAARPAPAKRDDEFEYRPHVDQTTDDGVQADARAARRAAARRSASRRSSASGSASAAARRGSPRHRVTGSPARSASTARRRGSAAARASIERVDCDRVPDPRAAGRRRRRHHRRRTTRRSSRR